MSDWPNNDPTSLRLAWFLVAMAELGHNDETQRMDGPRDLRAAGEALWNVVRLRPSTHWRSGVRLVGVHEDDV